MRIKLLSLLLTLTLVTSCDQYSREKYPQLVSKTESYQYINSCYYAEFDDLKNIPEDIRDKITSHLKNRMEINNFKRLKFDNGYVLSDQPIDIKRSENEREILALLGQIKEKTDCDTILDFPIYSVVFELKWPEIGIESMGLNLMIDKNGKSIKDIDFPKAEFADKIIPIDSVHAELIRRKIPYKKLNIDLWFDKKTKSLIWATNTLIRHGSITWPSCFPEVDYHFKMNAISGKVTEFSFEDRENYFVE